MKLPPPFSWLWNAWMAFAHVLGRVMSFLILTVLWIIGFGIYGIVMKLVRLVKRTPPSGSYWIDAPEEIEGGMKYQF